MSEQTVEWETKDRYQIRTETIGPFDSAGNELEDGDTVTFYAAHDGRRWRVTGLWCEGTEPDTEPGRNEIRGTAGVMTTPSQTARGVETRYCLDVITDLELPEDR